MSDNIDAYFGSIEVKFWAQGNVIEGAISIDKYGYAYIISIIKRNLIPVKSSRNISVMIQGISC